MGGKKGQIAWNKGITKYDIVYENKLEYNKLRRRIVFGYKPRLPKQEQKLIEKRRLKNIRLNLMEILGGSYCKECGFNIYEALQFDHINGGGCNDRRRFHSGRLMYQFYITNPQLAKQTLQVLCANCNFMKRHKQEGELN